MNTVRSWGIAGSVVDAGLAGRMWLGQSRGGAVDTESLRLANRLVGNDPTTPAYESSGGLTLEFDHAIVVALAGAVADIRVTDGPPVGWGTATQLPAGATLHVGRLLDGARVYVAVRAPDAPHQPISEPIPRSERVTSLRLWEGPRRDWFDDDALSTLCASSYTVTATSRVGVRLGGSPLARVRTDELASEGLVEGAVQVPPDGLPIVMLADHPTTGGYPVIAVVDPADVHHAAQAAVGTELQFTMRR